LNAKADTCRKHFIPADPRVWSIPDLKAVPPKYRKIIPDYIKDYVSLNQFVA